MSLNRLPLIATIFLTHSITMAAQVDQAPVTQPEQTHPEQTQTDQASEPTPKGPPHLSLQTMNGEKVTLDQYVGKDKWTVVVFWSTDCGICKIQQPEYSDFHNRHKDKDVEVIGIAIDGTDNMQLVKNYLQNNPVAYSTLVGDRPEIREKYKLATQENFRGTPTYWLFSPSGKLIGNQPGMLPVKSLENYIAQQDR